MKITGGKQIILSIFMVILMSCGGGVENSTFSDSGNTQTNANFSNLGQKVNLTFSFSTQINSLTNNDLDTTIGFDDEFTLPMYVNPDGYISFAAQEFPKIVLRICATGSADPFCDKHVSGLDDDIDLVLDVCGGSVEDINCGVSDSTVYQGTLSHSGTITINTIAVRVRAFFVTGDLDGFIADPEDKGIAEFNRIYARLTTGLVSTGTLQAQGDIIKNNEVKLVAGGILPSKMEDLSGAHYIAIIEGRFNQDPVSLLD